MKTLFIFLCFCVCGYSASDNVTIDYVPLQLPIFKKDHLEPIGILTTSSGSKVDIRKTSTLNTNLFANPHLTEEILHVDKERIPERVVHARGSGAHGYFVVTHDVSKYTSADLFNGIGKKTPVFGRFSLTIQNKGGPEPIRDSKALALKYYTREGNFDHLCLHQPVFLLRNPNIFTTFTHSDRRNPKTNLYDFTMFWDFRTLQPDAIHTALWILSEYGIPDGYRKTDYFPIHTYELSNKHGSRYYVKFNYRTELGLANLTSFEAAAIASQDPDYFTRDLYNAIKNKKYPSWRLEMDIIPFDDLQKLHYNPFDLTKLWEKGTYFTLPVGRLVLDRNPENFHSEVELSAFNPGNLVPGINGGLDFLFTSRLVSYPDAHHYRFGVNHNNIEINRPKYSKHYLKDGVPPVLHNMKDAPNYFPNSFNGPLPYVDTSSTSERLIILESNAVDLGNAAYFYNHVLLNENSRRILARNIATSLETVLYPVKERVLALMALVNPTLGSRVATLVKQMETNKKPVAATKETYAQLAKCMEIFS